MGKSDKTFTTPVRAGPHAAQAPRLRPAVEDDLEFVYRLLRLLAEEVGEAEEFLAEQADVARHAFGAEACYETLIAELDGRPAGLATYFHTYSTYAGRPCLYVNDIIVEPWARGANLGRILMARLCRLARERDCCRVELRVMPDNPARGFYEQIGLRARVDVRYAINDEALATLATADGDEE